MMDAPKPRTSITAWGRFGLLMSIALLAGLGVWSWQTQIAGAVIAQGAVAVEGRSRPVQHPDGGVVEDIHVADGQPVRAGEVLARLDDTLLRANLEIYRIRLGEALARRDRLEAERAEAEAILFDGDSDLVSAEMLDQARVSQAELFDARHEVAEAQAAQVAEQIAQFGNQIAGIEGLLDAKTAQLDLLGEEMRAAETLDERGLMRASQMSSLRREEADLLGQIAEHRSDLARIANSIRDAELRGVQQRAELRGSVVGELAEVTVSIYEMSEQIISTQEQLERVAIRAPVSGLVHEMQVTTIGAVIPPGGVLLEIVPQDERLVFELRVDPTAIDQVWPGQSATARFTAFNQRTTPEVDATVRAVSPSSVVDPTTGLSYYRVFLDISDVEIAKLGDVDLIPGMPLDGYLETGDRSVMSYLARPVVDQFAQAFRER
ncbi:MAG: HlyD family type I secretion periplasmic adaptor subunit [Pseudomonadota bacterium]